MKTQLYQIYDTEAECFVGPIIAAQTDGLAARIFSEIVQGQNDISKYPDDFKLVRIGTQGVPTGILEPLVHETVLTGRMVMNAVMLAKAKESSTEHHTADVRSPTPDEIQLTINPNSDLGDYAARQR